MVTSGYGPRTSWHGCTLMVWSNNSHDSPRTPWDARVGVVRSPHGNLQYFSYPWGPARGPYGTRKGVVRHPYGHVRELMPQSHPTTGPVRFLSPVRFLARKAQWGACRNFTPVLYSWSHQATGPARLDTAVLLWFDRIIRRTPQYKRTGISYPRGPARARVAPTRDT